MTAPTERRWIADRSIGWRIVLTARPAAAPAADRLGAALGELYADQGWSSAPPVVADDSLDRLRRRLTAADPQPLLLGLAGRDVVVSAHHAAVDGLGLLTALERCGVGPVTSAARGLGDRRERHGLTAGAAGRLAEALLRPPARPRGDGTTAGGHDVLVEGEVAGARRTSDLVHAATGAVVEWQAAAGAPARHVAVAIGASRTRRASGAPLADDSTLLRLRDVERLDRDAVEQAIRDARPEPSPQGARGALGAAVGIGLRALRPRLGSTVLVSHLGAVTAPAIERLAFHPVTAGGSGISLGALTHRERTVLTLRARGARWDHDGLERLLEAIIRRL